MNVIIIGTETQLLYKCNGYTPTSIIMELMIMTCRSCGKDSVQAHGHFHVDCLECLHLIREEHSTLSKLLHMYKIQGPCILYMCKSLGAIYLVVECINECCYCSTEMTILGATYYARALCTPAF